MKKKIGSATLVVIMFSIIYILYSSSTYADVRHLKNNYDTYIDNITKMYEEEYEYNAFEI